MARAIKTTSTAIRNLTPASDLRTASRLVPVDQGHDAIDKDQDGGDA
jgi:hypothetical protein